MSHNLHESHHRIPDFAIVGAAKSASTWLHKALLQHPEVVMPRQETAFFEDPFYDELAFCSFVTELPPVGDAKLLGIKRPNYFTLPECAKRLAKHMPDAKFIVLLRNPVDRAISAHYHLMRAGRFPNVTADVAFSQYLGGSFIPPTAKAMVMDGGNYAAAYKNYRKYFSSDQILLISDTQLKNDLKDVYTSACRFLNVSVFNAPRSLALPRNQGIYSMPLLKIVGALNRLRYAYDAETGVSVYRRGKLAAAAGYAVRASQRVSAIGRLLLPAQRSPLSKPLRKALLEFYLPDIKELNQLTELDLSPWLDELNS
jgi:hypothetical protein